MRRTILSGSMLLISLVLSACLPVTSSSPIGGTAAANIDPRLGGMWKGRFGTSTDVAYLTFYPQKDGSMKIVMLAPPAAGDDGGWMVFAARGVKLGSFQYLDVRQTDDGGKLPDPRLAHVPVLYRIGDDGLLVLWLVDEAAARSAIQSGRIAGKVESGAYGDVTLTATPAALDAFLGSAAGRALFTKPLTVAARVK